jgi:aryl-alcohol dehydrogenase-like predicted oxidoreductase
MTLRSLGKTGLHIAPLVFGGNVFGWTADEQTSFKLLDAFVDAGFNAIDTADVYSSWVPGNRGGESETIIGKWLKANPAKRDQVLILTKVGMDMGEGCKGLSERWILRAVEDSLKRLQTDRIDLYQSHKPDPETPFEETLGAHAKLLAAGKVRAIGASNLDASQLEQSLAVARQNGLPRYETLQPEYNLYTRGRFDQALQDLTLREEIGVITFYSLASGFLSGKYRSKADVAQAARAVKLETYFDDKGLRILAALDRVSVRHGATPTQVALAWLLGKKAVTAPIVSATSLPQLQDLLKAVDLVLDPADMADLDQAGA